MGDGEIAKTKTKKQKIKKKNVLKSIHVRDQGVDVMKVNDILKKRN
jgi:hypothetical protein